jgi:hypothetical protein
MNRVNVNLTFDSEMKPTSPPPTPGTVPHMRYASAANHITPNHKRRGYPIFTQSPPFEFIEPTGQGYQFRYTRNQGQDLSSRPSTASGAGPETTSVNSDVQPVSPICADVVQPRAVEYADFELEEIASDSGIHSESEILHPDMVEEVNSEHAAEERLEADTHISGTFAKLNCGPDSESESEQSRRYRKKKKRWSAGVFKRTHSQSVGSDSDIEDAEAMDAHDVGSSARRLRRRVRGPGDRSSLIFEDIPGQQIMEVEEPEEAGASKRPPSISSDDEGFTLDAMPFWVLKDPMVIDSASSDCSSEA